jgi:methylated-DNA-[protein]-cysteine S-methyltransferase
MEINYFASPIGCIEFRIEQQEITSVRIVTEEKETHPISETALLFVTQMREYFDGKRRDFDLPIRARGTVFQEVVWDALLRIPYGESISYQQLAKNINLEKASRAVGNANGKNPICILIPCHRVVRANGEIGGYAYGAEVKKFLLDLEKQNVSYRNVSK